MRRCAVQVDVLSCSIPGLPFVRGGTAVLGRIKDLVP